LVLDVIEFGVGSQAILPELILQGVVRIDEEIVLLREHLELLVEDVDFLVPLVDGPLELLVVLGDVVLHGRLHALLHHFLLLEDCCVGCLQLLVLFGQCLQHGLVLLGLLDGIIGPFAEGVVVVGRDVKFLEFCEFVDGLAVLSL
jgi:hypothetical protein